MQDSLDLRSHGIHLGDNFDSACSSHFMSVERRTTRLRPSRMWGSLGRPAIRPQSRLRKWDSVHRSILAPSRVVNTSEEKSKVSWLMPAEYGDGNSSQSFAAPF
jgi:hypothetical protein